MAEHKKCACGCGSFPPSPPYTSNGKEYATAYCILIQAKTCSYCGGGYADNWKETHEFPCRCNFEALDN